MKILAISGSPRDKTTNYMLRRILKNHNDSELILLKDLSFCGCEDCRFCHKENKCCIGDDLQGLFVKMENADVLIFGSPTYFDNVSGLMKNFMDRCVHFWFSRKLEGKNAIIITSGNFEDCLEFDENGNCKWHNEEIESVKNCLDNMKIFCKHLGIKVIDKTYSLHENPSERNNELDILSSKIKNL